MAVKEECDCLGDRSGRGEVGKHGASRRGDVAGHRSELERGDVITELHLWGSCAQGDTDGESQVDADKVCNAVMFYK